MFRVKKQSLESTVIANACGQAVYASVTEDYDGREALKIEFSMGVKVEVGPFGGGFKLNISKTYQDYIHKHGVAKILPGHKLMFPTGFRKGRLATLVTDRTEVLCCNYRLLPDHHLIAVIQEGECGVQLGFGKSGEEFQCTEGVDHLEKMREYLEQMKSEGKLTIKHTEYIPHADQSSNEEDAEIIPDNEADQSTNEKDEGYAEEYADGAETEMQENSSDEDSR